MITALEKAVIGFIAGIVLGSTGIAWGAITVPSLLLLGLSPSTSKGVSLTAEIVVSATSSVAHRRVGNVNRSLTLPLLSGVVGAFLGATLACPSSQEAMKLIIGVYEVLAGTLMVATSYSLDLPPSAGRTVSTAAVGFIAGFTKGFLGTGWGPLGMPLLTLLGAVPREAVASTLITRIPLTAASAAVYTLTTGVDLASTLIVAATGAIGSVLGSLSTAKVGARRLRRYSGTLLLALGIVLIAKSGVAKALVH